ncbi:hypothetical protein [Microbacterium capsulatum]|uniref:Uncharacterized protein n=1 Tax=Microbacterium capsulatum TaxID=3041921 RepID=A0ABU0XDU0_9MICO|nr:hypothetical protein [Microbacterium sp. ASV81]MDQ4213272.1 hypothetical protein [Microbacterium sp. ASV81]
MSHHDQLTDLFGRPVNPQRAEDRPLRSVEQPPPDVADRPGHTITRAVLRMSGTSRAAYYAAPITRASCSCGWSAESSHPVVVVHLTEAHLIATTEPSGSGN